MAKRAKRAKPFIPETIHDERGYESDGMFYWGGTETQLTEENIEKWVDDFNTQFTQTAQERISALRRHVSQFIYFFVDGPLTEDESRAIRGRTITRLNIATGDGIYALHKGLPKKGYWTDAIDAIHAMDELTNLLAQTPQDIDRIVRAAIHIGVLVTQAQLRAIFAPEVLLARKRRKAAAKAGKATARFTAEIRAIAEPIFGSLKRSKLSDDRAAQRTAARLHAEFGLEFSAKTIKRHLASKKLDNA